MLLFLTTLRHPLNSGDYGRCLRLLADSLASVCGQTSDAFAVMVVANRPIDTCAWTARVRARTRVLTVDMPAPAPLLDKATGLAAMRRDRGSKLALGLLAAAGTGASHVMCFDADDFLSRDIAAFVAAHPAAAGWLVRDGLMLRAGEVARLADFNRYCGSCHIVSMRLLLAPLQAVGLAAGADYRRLWHLADPHFLRRVLGSHLHLPDWVRARGRTLAELPFDGAVYHLGHGENHSGFRAPSAGVDTRRFVCDATWAPLSAPLRAQFGLPDTGPGLA